MDTIDFERSCIDELTTLEKALEVYHKDKFLSVKRELLEAIKQELRLPGLEFDEEAQIKIWQDYNDLFRKAVLRKFEKEDRERLEYYHRLEGHYEILSFGGTKLYFPTNITRDASGRMIGVTSNFLDNEINKRWFNHIYNVLADREDVRMCAEKDCSNLFIRKRRKDKKFCSATCRNRDWQRKHRRKKLQ